MSLDDLSKFNYL